MNLTKISKAALYSAITIGGSFGFVFGLELITVRRPWLSEEQRVLEQRIAHLDRFPGNLEEYNRLKRAEYEIMETVSNQKYVIDDAKNDQLSSLVQQGCKGLIYWQPTNQIKYLGVPVQKK